MAIERASLIRRAASVSVVAIAVTLAGATAPIASAAPVAAHSVSSLPALDSPAAWAAVKAAAASGYAVPDKFGANCGAKN